MQKLRTEKVTIVTTSARLETALAAMQEQAHSVSLPPDNGDAKPTTDRARLAKAQAVMARHKDETRAIYRALVQLDTTVLDVTADQVVDAGFALVVTERAYGSMQA
jgi:hypothetical protein